MHTHSSTVAYSLNEGHVRKVKELDEYEIYEQVLRSDPRNIREFSDDRFLNFERSDLTKTVKEIWGTGGQTRVTMKQLVLVTGVLEGRFSIDQLGKIVENDDIFLEELLRVSRKENAIGKKAVDEYLGDILLRSVREMNNLHDESDDVRFAAIQEADVDRLYGTLVYGSEELYTSSFNGIFDRLLREMDSKSISGETLLDREGYNKFRTFVELCVIYDRFDDFLSRMSPEGRSQLMKRFVSDIETAQDMLHEAVIVAEAFSAAKDPVLIQEMQRYIKEAYEQSGKNEQVRTLYGLLSSLFGGKAIVDKKWFHDIAKEYQLENLSGVASADLVDTNGWSIQRYYFYGDEDGHASFDHFLRQYRNDPAWTIVNHGKYVSIKSMRGSVPVLIYANLPEFEYEGGREIDETLRKNEHEIKIAVHRGHSYHAGDTISELPETAKIVALGSCGGYQRLTDVLQKTPSAHIISTKGIGTMRVNDPVFKSLSVAISHGENIEWQSFWENQRRAIGDSVDFQKYVPPQENLGVILLKAYRSVTAEETGL